MTADKLKNFVNCNTTGCRWQQGQWVVTMTQPNYCTVAVMLRVGLIGKGLHSLPGRVVLTALTVGSDVKTGNLTVTGVQVVRGLHRSTVRREKF